MNYSEKERDDLKKLLTKYPIITDTNLRNKGSQKVKRNVWKELTSYFNALPEHETQVSKISALNCLYI